MKKRFKFFLTGAAIIAALVGMVSCQKDWQKDIDDLGRQINDLTTQLNTLQGQIDNGEIVTNVTPIQGGIRVTTNKTSYDIVGQKGDGSVVKIGDDGYWYIDNKKTDYKAQGADGHGDYYVPGASGYFDKYSWNADKGAYDKTATDISYIAPGAITAVWKDDALTLYGVDGYEGGYTLELLTGLKGLAFVPERIFDGLGLITVYEFTAPANNTEFPFVNKDGEATFIATAPTEVTYRMDAANIDVDKYTWDFINREVYTKADADKTDLVKIEAGPEKEDSFVNFKIQLLKSVEPADHQKTNDIVALRAVGEDSEPVVSDYAYIEKETNSGYDLIHKDEYEKGEPRYYRTEADDVKIDADTDYNDGEGIEVKGNTNPATPVLVIDEKEEVDLLDYVETYAEQLGDLISTAGVVPTYKFYFAGFDDSDKIIISTDSKKATYLSDDDDKTNQNQFVILNDSKVAIDRDFVSAGRPAIGRTPLIYVQSIYNGVILAEGFIKLVIVEEEKEPEPEKPSLGYKVFIKHGGEFDVDSIPEEGTYVGSAFTDPNTALNYDGDNHELNVAWDEMNVKMFNELGMSFEEFQNAYNVDEPILIVKDANNGEPGDLPDEGKYEFSADLGELNNIYSDGLTITKLSPANWKQNTNIVDLKLDPEVEISGPHFVYVVYTAKDNTENVDAVVKFVYNVKHEHDYTLTHTGDGKWLLNPDYILGNQDELNPADPENYTISYAPYNKDDKGYGAVRIKGQDPDQEHPMRSGLTEHFLNYMTGFDINEESVYKFEIKNFTTDEVDWEVVDGGGTYGTTTYDDGEHAYVELTGAELKDVIETPGLVPYIFLNTENALIAKGYDVLVEVEENCEKLDVAEYGYYFVVFKALDAKLKVYNVKLGTFKEVNDYAYAHELVDGIFDAYNNKIFEWSDGAWVATEAAAVYGITGTEDLTVEVKSVLKYTSDSEESFGGNLYAFEEGASLVPAPSETKESGINWWNLGTDLQVDKKAEFTIVVSWGEDVLVEGDGTVLVLATANSIHALHDADDAVLDPVEYKDGWYYAVEAEAE
ncbi:MAG: hypothetical protein J6X64_02800 [Bacteroidales bacterium]|nr:hypothetical protein [Bacteroidales bacterium]